MRIAAISDIHGNLLALQAVLEHIAAQQVDLTVNLGDILSGPLAPSATADFLMPLDLPTIQGNHERQVLTQSLAEMGASDQYARMQISPAHLQWLEHLPAELTIGSDILLTHGSPGNDLLYLLETAENNDIRPATEVEISTRLGGSYYPLVLCGHTHTPRIVRLADGRLIVNPGSVGLQAYEADYPCPHTVQTGSPEARYAIVEKTETGWTAELHAVPYDYEGAAKLADARQREDWATALRSGILKHPNT